MKFDNKELRFLEHFLIMALEAEKKKLSSLDEESDEYIELANDLMILDTLISKIGKEKGIRKEL